jgi:hypothetical protein
MILTNTPKTAKCMSKQMPIVEAHHLSTLCMTPYCTSDMGGNSDVWLGKFSHNSLMAELSPFRQPPLRDTERSQGVGTSRVTW